MPSASPHPARLAALAVSGLLLAGAAGGCSTTQEKAERHRAEAEQILEARKHRQRKKQGDGPKTHDRRGFSAHRPEEGEQ